MLTPVPNLSTTAPNPRVVLRPIGPGMVLDPGAARATVLDPTLGLDAYAANAGDGPVTVRNIDFRAEGIRANLGAQFLDAIDQLSISACSFVGWDRGLACERVSAATGLTRFSFDGLHFKDCGTVCLILGDARGGRITRSIFDTGGWDPQGERIDPQQTHLLYINPENCEDITVDGCLFNNGRMNNTRCCGTVFSRNVSINGGCGVLGAHITRSIASNVVTLTHDPAFGVAAGGMGINADSPNGLAISGNLVVHAGSSATGNLYGIGVHGTYSNVAMVANVVFDWFNGSQGCGIGFGDNPGPNCQCTQNIVQMPNGGKCVEVKSGDIRNIRFGGNLYWSTDPEPFVVNGRAMTFDEWQALTGDTTSRFVQVQFADPGRGIERFVGEVLGIPVSLPGSQFCDACRLYPGLIRAFAQYIRDGFRTEAT